MKAVELAREHINEFIEYCKVYGPEQDESFLPDENFMPGENDPAFALLEHGRITGAASLILHPEFREAKKGRFGIFHCLNKTTEHYNILLDAISKKVKGIDNIYCFISENRTEVREIWESIGFSIERYSWVLDRELDDFKQPAFPEGFSMNLMREGIDEQHWCDLINICFATMAGHTHMTIDKLRSFKTYKGYINDDMFMLWDKSKPVGTMQLEKETDDGINTLFIEAVTVLPEYRGRGLGKNLIRSALEFALCKGYEKAMLSVNAENENAANLYLDEGFKKKELYICYHKIINPGEQGINLTVPGTRSFSG